MSQKTPNPFNQTDYLTEVIKSDNNYQASKKESFNQFTTQYKEQGLFINESKPSIFMKMFKICTTHSTAFALGLIIAGGAVGASAAENYAPQNYKPSVIFNELFKINKQTQKNPYTKLTADNENNVIVSKKCDVAIKYPKQISGEKIGVILQQPDRNNPTIIESINFDASRQLESAINDSAIPINNLSLTCRTSDFYSNDDPASNWIPVNKDILRKYTGWFIAIENDITEFKMAKTQIGEQFQTFKFKFKDKFYDLSFHTRENLKPILESDEGSNFYLKNKGLFGEQIQIQFNSLISSDSNIILDYQASSSSASTSSSLSVNSEALNIVKSVNQNLNSSNNSNNSTQKTSSISNNGDKWTNKSIFPLLNVPLENGWQVKSEQTNSQITTLVLIKDNINLQLVLAPKIATGGLGYQCFTEAKKINDKLFRGQGVDIIEINPAAVIDYYPISQFSFDKNIIEENLKSNEDIFGKKYSQSSRSKINACGGAFETATVLMTTNVAGANGQARVKINVSSTTNTSLTEVSLLEVDKLITKITGLTIN